jgi:hypothetical protein
MAMLGVDRIADVLAMPFDAPDLAWSQGSVSSRSPWAV